MFILFIYGRISFKKEYFSIISQSSISVNEMVPTFGGFESQLRAVFGICYPHPSENMNSHSPIVNVDDDLHLQNKVSETPRFKTVNDITKSVSFNLQVCIKPEKIDRTQKCRICDKILSSPSSYYVHMKSHSQSKPFQCNFCDAAFCRKPYLSVSIYK